MTKPREKTREELTAEIEDSKKKIQQYENREKILRQKLSKEERRTRSHRLIVRGAVFESIVPEAKNMTDEEAAGCFCVRFMLERLSICSFILPVIKLKVAPICASSVFPSDGTLKS